MAVTFARAAVFLAHNPIERPAMKLVHFLSRFALVGIPAVILGVAFDLAALGLFAVAASALVLLIGASDYAPRRLGLAALASRRREAMPLAA